MKILVWHSHLIYNTDNKGENAVLTNKLDTQQNKVVFPLFL